MRATTRRRAPNSACHACRRLKMRCVRTSAPSCERCVRVGRACVAVDVFEASSADGHSPAQPAPAQPAPAPERIADDVMAPERETDTTSTRPATISSLPSIYSTSPAFNHQSDSQDALLVALEPQRWDEVLSAEDAAQWLQIFRKRLLSNATVLEPADFSDSETLFKEFPNLVICIVYVTSRYVPGYNSLRRSLKESVLKFLQSNLAPVSSTPERQLTDLQALIILYIFTRSVAIERVTESLTSVDFWSVKAVVEAQAIRMRLHRSAEPLAARIRSGESVQRSERCVKLYTYWLWLFSTSHHVAIVTGTPPTIAADASIRAAPALLESFRSDSMIVALVAEVEFCLIWYTLGLKDPRIKEWWSSSAVSGLAATDATPLRPEDVDAALAACKHRSWLTASSALDPLSLLSTSPDYYLHHTRFCLHTFFLPRISVGDYSASDVEAVTRCVDSALSVLNLSHKIGPAGRDQLRYVPGFLFVMLSYCSSFVLKATKAFPGTVPNSAEAIDTVRRIAEFMVDLGLERGHGGDAFAAGQSVLRQIFTMQQEHTQQPSPAPSMLHSGQAQNEHHWMQDVFDQQFLDSGYSFLGWDERSSFG